MAINSLKPRDKSPAPAARIIARCAVVSGRRSSFVSGLQGRAMAAIVRLWAMWAMWAMCFFWARATKYFIAIYIFIIL